MTNEDQRAAVEIGWGRAEFHGDPMVGEDADDFDDRIFPLAFSDALEQFPQYEALELSGAVHEGILSYYAHVCGRDESIYRGESIERDHRGFYLAHVLVTPAGSPDYFRPLQADTLVGIWQLIDETKGDRA